MYDLIARPLSFFYSIWPSYAGAITLLTLTIMLVLLPLTLKGTRSMLATQQLQPEMKKIQARYKDDRQKLNEEMLKFYKENDINPVAGCLPLLLQIPVFFFLYRTIIGLTHRAPYGYDMGAAVSRATSGATGSGAGAEPGIWEQFGNFWPQHLDKSSSLYESLHANNKMTSWGMDLADSALKAFTHGIGTAWPYFLIVLIVAGTSYIQQKQISGRMPQSQVNQQQQMLLKVMPVFFAAISLGIPAAVVVYFLVSNLFRIGQQALITKTMYSDGGTLASMPGGSTAKAPSGVLGLLGFGSSRSKGSSKPKQKPKAKAIAAKSGGKGAQKSAGRPAAKGGQAGRAKGSTKAKQPTKGTAKAAASSAAAKPAPEPKQTTKQTSDEQATTGRSSKRPARGAAARPAPPEASTSGNGASNGGGKAAAPSRSTPPAPTNRSRSKKKRK